MEVFLQRLAVSDRQSSGSHRPGHELLGSDQSSVNSLKRRSVEVDSDQTDSTSVAILVGGGEQLKLSRVSQAFLKSKDADRRLDHLKDQLQRGGKQIPPEQQTEVTEWLEEQRGEVSTFRSHCHNRQQQMESLLSDLSRYH